MSNISISEADRFNLERIKARLHAAYKDAGWSADVARLIDIADRLLAERDRLARLVAERDEFRAHEARAVEATVANLHLRYLAATPSLGALPQPTLKRIRRALGSGSRGTAGGG